MLYYFINDEREPSFVVDVTAVYSKKIESLFAHASQFRLGAGEIQTRLNMSSGLLHLMESRDRLFGAKAGVGQAEGFALREPLLLDDPLGL